MSPQVGSDTQLALLSSVGLFALRLVVGMLAGARSATRHAPRPFGVSSPRRPAARPASKLLSLLGFAIVVTSAPAAGSRRAPVTPSRDARRAPEPPWSGTSEFSPPRSLVRTGHPALHARGPARGERLFPRQRARPGEDAEAILLYPPRPRGSRRHHAAEASSRSEREESRAQAYGWVLPPAESGAPAEAACGQRYVVRVDDTLWDIAAAALETDDPRRIARFWPLIHWKNRAVVGPDPDLIRPGQVLELPLECGS
jgi:hypothetical protein